jgi:predicted membrane-bound spermidine synthase
MSASTRATPVLGAGMAYFIAVGAGFMFVELAMVQRLSVFLGHPVYAMGVLLATIVASAGIGALLSERITLTSTVRALALPLLCAVMALTFAFLVDIVAARMQESGRAARIAVTVLMVAPSGVVMGLFVPIGLRLTQRRHANDTPWYWALNGVVSVLCSALAVLVAITSGVHANFFIGSVAYLATAPALARLAQQDAPQP